MKQLEKIHFELKFETSGRFSETLLSLKDIVNRNIGYIFIKPDKRQHIDEGQIIYHFIQSKVNKYFKNNRDYEVVVANYSEKEGSFIVEFSLAIIGVISNYESFYKSLELLVDDLRTSFYSHEYNHRISYNEEYGYINYRNDTSISKNNAFSKMKPFLPVAFLLLSVAGIFDDEIFSHFDNKAGIESQRSSFNYINDYEYYIEKQVKEEMTENYVYNSRMLLERELRQAEFERDTAKQELIEELQSQLGMSIIGMPQK